MGIKNQLLIGIIQEYIKSGEPIGSEFLKSQQNLHVSSATIRNYFKILEKEGALFQPHISSGRIPTNATLHEYWKRILQDLHTSVLTLNASQLQALSAFYGIYCIVMPKSDNTLESIMTFEDYLILRFRHGEAIIGYSQALARFLESFLHLDINEIIKVASNVGAGELRRKLIALLQVSFEEHSFQCGSEFIGGIASVNARQYLDAMQGRTLLVCGNGIYFDTIVPDGYMAIIHDVDYSHPKTKRAYSARMLCMGDLLRDYKGFYAGLGLNNFA